MQNREEYEAFLASEMLVSLNLKKFKQHNRVNLPDDRIYQTKEELAASSGRKPEDITEIEYEKYLDWMGSERF